MWTQTTRRRDRRDSLRYETDLTNAESALIEPLLPEPHARGRPRRWPAREILNAIFYVLRGDMAWRLLPSDLPLKSTVFSWFSLWRDTGLVETINHLLVMADRERVGRKRRRLRQLGPSSMPRPSCSSSVAWDAAHDCRTNS